MVIVGAPPATKNVTNLVRPMIKDGALRIDTSDELARQTLGLSAPTPA